MSRGAELVVVGAGSAGAVIAARVTERSDREVLLLEAGPDYPVMDRLPRDLRDGTRNSWRQHDWGYHFRPTPGQILFVYPRGKVVGGSSAVNTCIAIRPQPHDLDEWAARGLPDWSFEQCFPYLLRLENDLDFTGPLHSQSGPIPIRRHPPSELVPWQAAFVEAAKAAGHPENPDINAPNTSGVGPHAMNKIDGVRMSAARCYLTPEVRNRPNFALRAGVLVRRVLFDGRRVKGVELDVDGRVEILATRKVVLAAGAINTPSILLRSGVGPRKAVERIGAELVAEVPAIGARLLDHPGAAIILRARWSTSKLTHPLLQTVLRYTSKGSSSPNDMQLQPGSFLPLHPRITLPTVTLMCSVGKPKGHMTMRFESADPRARPKIFGDVFVRDDDRARAVEALEMAYALASEPAMRGLASFLWPSAKVLKDRAALDRWIFKSCGSGYHPCGTVPMGADDDADAATDARGRVRGVEGLYVCDASLMPTVPSMNTNLTALMMGERFGEWLRAGAL